MNKFESNLLSVSASTNIIKAKTEWSEIFTEKRAKRDGLCLCNHSLRNVIYLYNLKTNKTISVGVKCAETFNLIINNKLDDTIKRILKDAIEKRTKKDIIIVDIFCEDVKQELIKICNGWLIKYNDDIEQLCLIQIKIEYLINNQSVNYINDILIDVNNRIKLLKEQEKVRLNFRAVLNMLTFEYVYKQEQLKINKKAEQNKRYLYLIEQHLCFKCLNKINMISYTTYDDDFTNCGEFVCCNLCARIINDRIDSNYKGGVFND